MNLNSLAASYIQGLLLAHQVGLSSKDLLAHLLRQKDNFGM